MNILYFLQASRAHILKKATDYIVMMKTKNHKHRSDIESMRQQTRTLEEQGSTVYTMNTLSLDNDISNINRFTSMFISLV